MRYDLRRGTFREAWNEFTAEGPGARRQRVQVQLRGLRASFRLPLVRRVCLSRNGRYSAPIPYLCETAAAERRFKRQWPSRHRRYFQIAGITVRVESDLDFSTVGFPPELTRFAAEGPGDDNVTLRHYFELAGPAGRGPGRGTVSKSAVGGHGRTAAGTTSAILPFLATPGY